MSWPAGPRTEHSLKTPKCDPDALLLTTLVFSAVDRAPHAVKSSFCASVQCMRSAEQPPMPDLASRPPPGSSGVAKGTSETFAGVSS